MEAVRDGFFFIFFFLPLLSLKLELLALELWKSATSAAVGDLLYWWHIPTIALSLLSVLTFEVWFVLLIYILSKIS